MQVLFKLLPDNAYIELNLWFHKYNQLIMPRVRDDIRVSNWPFIIARHGDADVALWTAKFSQFDPGHNNIELLTYLHAILFLNICKPPLNTFCRISRVQVSLLNYYITYQVSFVPHWDWIKSQGNKPLSMMYPPWQEYWAEYIYTHDKSYILYCQYHEDHCF